MTARAKAKPKAERKPRTYVAGPMRGVELFNFPAFHAAEADLVERGWDVHNPARWDEEQGFEPAKTGAEDEFDVQAALKHDIEVITTWAEYVFVLPGWQDSLGARLEVAVAQATGIPVVDYVTGVSVVGVVSTAVAV
jgi:hypothetical protein